LATLRRLGRRPTLWVEVGLAAAWTALLLLTADGAQGENGGAWNGGQLWVCMTGIGEGGGAHHAVAAASSGASPLLAEAPMWGLMAFAMMVPTAMPAVRHVGLSSVYWRRRRATVEFLAVYVGVWLAFGIAAVAVIAWGPSDSPYVLAAALALAALWQLTPAKQRALLACHRSRPLPPHGWRASAGTARFGLYNGASCLVSCWAMMLAAAVAGAGILWMGAMTVAMGAEKLAERPRRATRRLALLLGAAAIGVAAAALLG
jgi:predicted metal-binding membrane protein